MDKNFDLLTKDGLLWYNVLTEPQTIKFTLYLDHYLEKNMSWLCGQNFGRIYQGWFIMVQCSYRTSNYQIYVIFGPLFREKHVLVMWTEFLTY